MPRPDPAFSWLLEHDPQAAGLSRRQYAEAVGILSPQDELDLLAKEECYSDEMDGHHCTCCADRAEMRRRTVE